MEILLVALAVIFTLIGFIGCVVPALPGPPLNFLALVFLNLARDPDPYGMRFLIIMGIIAVGITIVDNVVPAWGAKRYGASRISVWMALAGTLIGVIFFGPIGIILGAFLGALLGELISGKETRDALKAGWGVFIGVFTGIILKVIVSGVITFYFIKELI